MTPTLLAPRFKMGRGVALLPFSVFIGMLRGAFNLYLSTENGLLLVTKKNKKKKINNNTITITK